MSARRPMMATAPRELILMLRNGADRRVMVSSRQPQVLVKALYPRSPMNILGRDNTCPSSPGGLMYDARTRDRFRALVGALTGVAAVAAATGAGVLTGLVSQQASATDASASGADATTRKVVHPRV